MLSFNKATIIGQPFLPKVQHVFLSGTWCISWSNRDSSMHRIRVCAPSAVHSHCYGVRRVVRCCSVPHADDTQEKRHGTRERPRKGERCTKRVTRVVEEQRWCIYIKKEHTTWPTNTKPVLETPGIFKITHYNKRTIILYFVNGGTVKQNEWEEKKSCCELCRFFFSVVVIIIIVIIFITCVRYL